MRYYCTGFLKKIYFFPLIIEKWLISNDDKKIIHELAAGTTIVDS